mgnify:CR=1 FL=1
MAAIGAALLVWYLFLLPTRLFKGDVYSTVVLDCSGNMLGARIADDGQWRFPECDSVPYKFAAALTQFEDRYFFKHDGVNILALGRALIGNIKSGKVTSGGSTLTMQLVRLSRPDKPRTIGEKFIEAIIASRLEASLSKREILALYASHAPFGGNVVGLEAAAWRYFGRPASELSWAESATLAVLPNAPANVHPGKNREALLGKRNRLLKRLRDMEFLNEEDYQLALDEPLVLQPKALPQYAPHLTEFYNKTRKGETVTTGIRLNLQQRVTRCVNSWNTDFSKRGIADLAAIVIDVHSGEVIAYCGNAAPGNGREGAMVDIPNAPRSTGSVLKPFLFCASLQDGTILPGTLMADLPLNIGGFSPRNFDLEYHGAVPANTALARSLNVPAVNMLRQYGIPRFYKVLQDCGMTTLTRSAEDYGLSIILGGAEGRLLDITRIYASMSKTYQTGEPPRKGFPLTDRVALWHTFEALKGLGRPDEIDLRLVRSVRPAAWKTGTSWGFRDAWAVGVTPDYAVGVWAGNADGSGVPGLTGAMTAGPVLFDILNMLPQGGWFQPPADSEGLLAEVCPQSGHLRGRYCPQADTLLLPREAENSSACPYHKTADRAFELPPAMEWYYKKSHPELQAVKERAGASAMAFIYPENGSKIHLSRQLGGDIGGVVFNLAHRSPAATVWWHLDGEYIGRTSDIHQFTLSPSPGVHHLTVVDASGNSKSISFEIK